MTLWDLLEVNKGAIKKIKLGAVECCDLVDFIQANLICGSLLGPRDYKVKKIYSSKEDSGICVELEVNLKKED